MLAGEGQASPGEFERVLKSVRDDTCFSQKRQQDRLVRVMSRGLERVKRALQQREALAPSPHELVRVPDQRVRDQLRLDS